MIRFQVIRGFRAPCSQVGFQSALALVLLRVSFCFPHLLCQGPASLPIFGQALERAQSTRLLQP